MNNLQFNELIKEASDERLAYMSIVLEIEIVNRMAQQAGYVEQPEELQEAF
jgi:hypothetical protein